MTPPGLPSGPPTLRVTSCSGWFSEAEPADRHMHPTAMMLTSTVNLLQTLCLSAGVHAEVMQGEAIRTLCGLLRVVVESGTSDTTRTHGAAGGWLSVLCVRVCVHVCVHMCECVHLSV